VLRRTAVAGALTAPVWLAACGLPGQAPPAPSEKEVTISYLTDWSGPAERKAYIDAALPLFAQGFPKLHVNVEWVDSASGGLDKATIANAAGGTLADVFLGGGDTQLRILSTGGLAEIGSVLKTMKFNMNDVVYVPSSIMYKGRQYGLPFQLNIAALTINKTLFKQAGAPLPDEKATWPQLLDSLRKVATSEQGGADAVGALSGTAGAPSGGTAAGPTPSTVGANQRIYGFQSPANPAHWMPFVWAWGGDRWTPDLKRSLLDQPEAIAGLQFLVDMIQRYRVATPLDDKGTPPPNVTRALGNLAISWTSGPSRTLSRTANFELDLMYHPLGPQTGKRAVHFADSPNLVSATASKRGTVEQSTRFLAWLCGSEVAQKLYCLTLAEVPALKKILLSDTYTKPQPGETYAVAPIANMHIMYDQIAALRDPQDFVGWTDARTAMHNALLPAFTGKQSVQDAAKEAARVTNLILAKIAQ